MTVVMACATPGGSAPGTHSSCPTGSLEPGVLRPSATGTGRDGRDCAGKTFTITEIDASQGKYSFDAGAPFTISDRCYIDYTVDVLRMPTTDANSSQDNTQTWMLTFASDGTSEKPTCNPGCGSSLGYTVLPGSPPPADSDGDRVLDEADQCPGTAPGTTVGADGRPVAVSPYPQAVQADTPAGYWRFGEPAGPDGVWTPAPTPTTARTSAARC